MSENDFWEVPEELLKRMRAVIAEMSKRLACLEGCENFDSGLRKLLKEVSDLEDKVFQ